MSGVVDMINSLVRSALVLPSWNAVFYLVEIWIFSFPKFLGGFETSDRRQLCANMLGRPYPEVTDIVWEQLCLPLFHEKLTAYSYFLAFLLFIFALRVLFWFYFQRASKNYRPRTEEARKREKETKLINEECRRFLRTFAEKLDENISPLEKMNSLRHTLTNLHPAVKREITHPLIGSASTSNPLHLE